MNFLLGPYNFYKKYKLFSKYRDESNELMSEFINNIKIKLNSEELNRKKEIDKRMENVINYLKENDIPYTKITIKKQEYPGIKYPEIKIDLNYICYNEIIKKFFGKNDEEIYKSINPNFIELNEILPNDCMNKNQIFKISFKKEEPEYKLFGDIDVILQKRNFNFGQNFILKEEINKLKRQTDKKLDNYSTAKLIVNNNNIIGNLKKYCENSKYKNSIELKKIDTTYEFIIFKNEKE